MGRVGTAAYDQLVKDVGEALVGFDTDPRTVTDQQAAHRRAFHGDATDRDFWDRVTLDHVELVILALPNHDARLAALERLRARGYHGRVAAIGKYDDEVRELKTRGVDVAHNLYRDAGTGFALQIRNQLVQNGQVSRAPKSSVVGGTDVPVPGAS